MENRLSWVDRPLWVRIGLFGIPSRKAAMLWVKGSLALAIVGMLAIVISPVIAGHGLIGLGIGVFLAGIFGPLMLMATLWYWLSIRWADEHDGWALHTWKS